MDAVSQIEALGIEPLAADERAVLFPARRFGGLDCLVGDLPAPYLCAAPARDLCARHDRKRLREVSRARGEHYAAPGRTSTFVNPLETHDGAPHEGGYSYRMTYLERRADARGRGLAGRERGRGHAVLPRAAGPRSRGRAAVSRGSSRHRGEVRPACGRGDAAALLRALPGSPCRLAGRAARQRRPSASRGRAI